MCTQQRLRSAWCPGWSESSLGAHAILLVLSWGSSFTFSPSGIENDLACCISVWGWGPVTFSVTLTPWRHTRLCHPGNIRDICPAREINPNDMGHLGFKSPSLLRQSLSKSGSRPHACNMDINIWAISIVKLMFLIHNGSGSLRCSRGDGVWLWLEFDLATFGGWLGWEAPNSTPDCNFCPTESAVSFTLAMIPEKYRKSLKKFWHPKRLL